MLKRKLKSSTLIEVIVSMIILLMIIGMTFKLYVSVIQNNNSWKKFETILKANNIINNNDFSSVNSLKEVINENGFLITKNVELFKEYNDIYLISIEITDENNGKVLIRKRQLFKSLDRHEN